MEGILESAAQRRLGRWERRDVAVCALLGIGSLTLYGRTLAPSLLLGDGAEFQTLAVTLGLAHPTGYPIYLLLGKLFTLLPFGSLPARVNLLSAVAATLALVLLYLLARRLGCRPLPALVGPLVLGLGGLFWWHAVMAEIYTGAVALIAGVLLLAMQWQHTSDDRFLAAAGLVGGLGLGVHATVALCAPAVLVYMLLSSPRRAAWGHAAAGAIIGVLLTLGAFVALDARDAPVSFYNSTVRPWQARWDLEPGRFETPMGRIAFLVSARQFQWAMGRDPLDEVVERAGMYWRYLRDEWGLLPVALMAVGAASLIRRCDPRSVAGGSHELHEFARIDTRLWPLSTRSNTVRVGWERAAWREGILLLGVWATMLAFVLNYSVYDVYVFFLPTYVPLALLASLGAASMCDAAESLAGRARNAGWRRYTPSAAGVLLVLAVVWPAAESVRGSLAAGRITFLDNTDFARYPYPVEEPEWPLERARVVAAALEDDALLYTDWGTVFTIFYVAHIEQEREGITVHEWFDPSDDAVVLDALTTYLDGQLEQRPVYINHIPPSLEGRYEFTPVAGIDWLYLIRPRT